MVAESFKRSHKVLALCVALAFASAALALGFAATANAEESGSTSQPTISSDKEDYPPGGTVILTGSGWQPGESVNIFVNDDEGKTWSRDVDVTADENGDIRDEFQIPDWFVATYYVTATGDSGSVAKTTFTDAKINLRADLGENQEWALRHEVYSQLNCTGSTVSGGSETKKGQSDSVIANPDVSGSRSVKLFASHKTVHTSNQVAHEEFDKWIQDGSTTTWPHQTQDNVTGFSTYNTQNPNGKGHWICVNGQNGAERTFVAVYKQSPPPALSINDVTVTEGNSGTTNAQFTVTRTGNTAGSSSVNYATADDTAQQPGDYIAQTGTLNFSAGQLSKTVNVPVVGDTLDESDETFLVNLSGANNATISDGQGRGTILDDDDTPNVPPYVDPPEVGQSGENQSSDEGENKSFDLGSFTDPDADGPWSVTVNWGDGSQNTTFQVPESARLQDGSFDLSGQHEYDDNGEYDVTVTVAENGPNAPSGQASFKITVKNVNPTALLNNDGPIDENGTVTVSFSQQADPSDADKNAGLRYAYNCDGSQFATIPNYADLAGNGDSKECSFADDGSFTVRALIMDKDGGYNVYSTEVTVNNVAPRVTPLSGPDLVKESTTAERTYTFTATDAGDDELTIEVGCGANGELVDANGADPGGTYTYDPATGEGSFKCIFPDGGPDGSTKSNVTVRATDDNGLSDSDNQVVIVTVENDNPQATFNAPNSVNEGDNIELSLTDATDPAGSNDTLEYAFKCGDADWSAFGASNTASCPTNDNGQVIVKGQVRDEDGGQSDVYEKTVTVNNVAPTANDDQMNTTELVAVTANLLDNDSDPGNDLDAASLRILNAGGPNDGGVTISALLDGNVSYLPDRGFIGADSFSYEVCDDDGDCSSADVQVTVGPVDCNAQGVIRGTQRADVLRGTAGNDIICAFAGKDTIYGGGGDDLLIGAEGDDRMWGQDGGDVMRGGANTDAMDGGLGDDYMSGDSGRDVMLGRGGIDFLDLLDGSAGDAGNGGAGTDTCTKDTGDRTVSCERRQ